MGPKLNIIVVEDHDALREITIEALSSRGHSVQGVESAEALPAIPLGNFDLMVIDLNLPGEDGISLAARIRRALPNMGIIMLTARNQLGDKIRGYESGADIYITKPAALDEIVSAVGALSRRIRLDLSDVAFRLDLDNRLLLGPKGKVELTRQEAVILSGLALAPRSQMEYWQLLECLGKSEYGFDKSVLEAPISRLRMKFGMAGAPSNPVKSIRNFGYQLCIALSVD